MATTDGYVQVAVDSTGKRVANFAGKIPAGTWVTDADGNQTQLTNDITVFMQRVALTDSRGEPIDELVDAEWQQAVIERMDKTNELLELLIENLS